VNDDNSMAGPLADRSAEQVQQRARGSGAQKIYDALKADILDLTLAPGEQLDEAGLSARFGLSRTPVREALVRLVAEGLASTLPNRNTIVSTVDYSSLPAYLDALTLMYRVTTRAAAIRHTGAELAAIIAAQAEFEDAVQHADALKMIDSNTKFHMAISRAAGNRYYEDLSARLLNEGTRLMRLYYRHFDDKLPRPYGNEHEAILAAITTRNAELADSLARQHATRIVGQLQRLLEPNEGADIRL
jgi:DNA-binding GntR family transcriptional regulator